MSGKTRMAYVIVDLGYGDAGKGTTADWLARQTRAHTVLRYNGSAQAAHNVITPDGRHHTFAQFGSPTFVPGVRTHLSNFMTVHPIAMMAEELHLQELGVNDAFARTTIDRETILISPYQQAANRLIELNRANGRHGSCGLGVGETRADSIKHPDLVLRAKDLFDKTVLRRKLRALEELQYEKVEVFLNSLPNSDQVLAELNVFGNPAAQKYFETQYLLFSELIEVTGPEYLTQILQSPGSIIFEAAQGVLLDEWHGFFPHTTWSNLTTENADAILSNYDGQVVKLGLTRAYSTRHGSGPFVTEDPELSENEEIQELHNDNNIWQREFRFGPLDLVTLRFALACIGQVDGLVVTNLDRMPSAWKYCDAYEYQGTEPELLPPFFEHQGPDISNIKVLAPSGDRSFPDPVELEMLTERTELLNSCSPKFCEINNTGNPADFADAISDLLDVPLAMTSFGPTAKDKKNINLPS